MMVCHFLVHFRNQVINLALHRADGDFRIQKPGRTDDLFHTHQLMITFIYGRGSGYKHHLVDFLLKLRKIKGSVIQRGRKPETIIHQC